MVITNKTTTIDSQTDHQHCTPQSKNISIANSYQIIQSKMQKKYHQGQNKNLHLIHRNKSKENNTNQTMR